jgi:hypothetical protein
MPQRSVFVRFRNSDRHNTGTTDSTRPEHCLHLRDRQRRPATFVHEAVHGRNCSRIRKRRTGNARRADLEFLSLFSNSCCADKNWTVSTTPGHENCCLFECKVRSSASDRGTGCGVQVSRETARHTLPRRRAAARARELANYQGGVGDLGAGADALRREFIFGFSVWDVGAAIADRVGVPPRRATRIATP